VVLGRDGECENFHLNPTGHTRLTRHTAARPSSAQDHKLTSPDFSQALTMVPIAELDTWLLNDQVARLVAGDEPLLDLLGPVVNAERLGSGPAILGWPRGRRCSRLVRRWVRSSRAQLPAAAHVDRPTDRLVREPHPLIIG
jgi:hypothetical protein